MKSSKSLNLKQDGSKSLKQNESDEPLMGTANLYLYIKTVRVNGKKYRYLIIEEYLGYGRRKTLLKLSVEEAIRRLLWCGGWDSNPRRPSPAGPKPAPFDLARAPPPKIKQQKHLISIAFNRVPDIMLKPDYAVHIYLLKKVYV